MCEATVYIVGKGQESEIMKDVMFLKAQDDHLLLTDLFGEQKQVVARIKSIDFMQHRVDIEEIKAPEPLSRR